MESPIFDSATLSLVILVAVVIGLFLRGAALAGSRTPIAAAVVVAWLGYSGILAARGMLLDPASLPPPMIRILAPGLLLVFIAAFGPFGARLAKHLGYAALIGFHAFRLPVEGLLWWFHHQGRLPVQMTFEGRNFDILTGLSAIVVAVLAWRGSAGRKTALVWNLAGLALLLNIMGVAILSIPGPLRAFHNEPANTLVLHFPYVWIPAIFVMAALLGHLVLFRKLWADRARAA
jgi:hypothetical protein